MKIVEEFVKKLDGWQRRRATLGFIFATVKKYSDDTSGHLAALITYYGFLSLFPLLIIATSLLQFIIGNSPAVHAKLLSGINSYFPVLGQDLSSKLHALHRSGIGLVIGLLFTLYGARGIADIFRFSINKIWRVPESKQPSFPFNIFNSLKIIFVGGLGILITVVLSSFASSLGHSVIIRVASLILSFIIFLLTLYGILRIGISFKKIPNHTIFYSSLVASIGLQVLVSIGGYIVTHELKHLSTLYGTFAIVLGLLFWIYLQAQVFLYAMQIGAVKHYRLWPRGLNSADPTAADKQIKVSF